MIQIPKQIVDEIFEQGKKESPIEACGYLAGKDGLVYKKYEMKNVDGAHDHFTLDPKEQFAVMKDARSWGLKIVAVYHTHPETPARPSVEDINLAFDPNITYVIASLIEGGETLKAFSIKAGEVTNLELEVIEDV